MTFEQWRNNLVHIQVYIYLMTMALFIWRTWLPTYNPMIIFLQKVFGSHTFLNIFNVVFYNVFTSDEVSTQPFGIISPREPHQLSFAFMFAFGLWTIRSPYFKVNDYRTLFWRIFKSIIILGFATTMIEGTWDLVYAYKYTILSQPNLVAGVGGGIALMIELFGIFCVMCIAQKAIPFNLKRLCITLLVLYAIYIVWWFTLGFVTSGAPYFSSSLSVALIELLHWGIGALGFAWSYKQQDNVTTE